MAETQLWFSTSEVGDHVSTRVYEVLLSGRALLLCDRNPRAFGPIGVVEGVHAAMFNSTAEFEVRALTLLTSLPFRAAHTTAPLPRRIPGLLPTAAHPTQIWTHPDLDPPITLPLPRLQAKALYYTQPKHEAERLAMVAAARALAVERHMWAHRALQFVADVQLATDVWRRGRAPESNTAPTRGRAGHEHSVAP
mgnify:CR=1 FL=1